MEYNQPIGIPDTEAPFIDGNPQSGILGSIIPAHGIEYPQREIVNAITDAGLTPSNLDLTQLAQAIRRSSFIYVVDQGSVNNIVISPLKFPGAYSAGLAYEVKVAVTNTDAATVNVSGLGPRQLVRMNGEQLVAGDIATGGIALIVYDGTRFQLLTSAAQFISEASLVHYGVDTGAANAYVATISPGITQYSPGLLCEIAISHTNTGASTINLNSKGVRNVVRANGAALSAGDLLAGGLALIGYDGTQFQLYNVQVAPGGAPGTTDQSITGPLRPYFIAVNSATVMAPPGSPAIGDTYLVPVGATGAWSGLGNQLSQWTGADGWHTRAMPTEHMVGVADTDDFLKHMPDGTWRSIFATVAECEAGTSTTLAVTPKGLRRFATILGPLWPYFIAVKSRTVSSPPGSPLLGDVYLVPSSGASGAWSGHGDELAQWDGLAWLFRRYPKTSMLGVEDTDDWWKCDGVGAGRSAYATLDECRIGTSTVTIVNPAGLAFALAQQPDELNSEVFFMGCFLRREGGLLVRNRALPYNLALATCMRCF
jgi:Protein of unknown function (DUF2793)